MEIVKFLLDLFEKGFLILGCKFCPSKLGLLLVMVDFENSQICCKFALLG